MRQRQLGQRGAAPRFRDGTAGTPAPSQAATGREGKEGKYIVPWEPATGKKAAPEPKEKFCRLPRRERQESLTPHTLRVHHETAQGPNDPQRAAPTVAQDPPSVAQPRRSPSAAQQLRTPSRTVKPVDGLLAQAAGDAAVNPLVLVAFILQEILQQVQHLRHLQGKVTVTRVALGTCPARPGTAVMAAPPDLPPLSVPSTKFSYRTKKILYKCIYY